MECRRPKYGMVCRFLESCQAKIKFMRIRRKTGNWFSEPRLYPSF